MYVYQKQNEDVHVICVVGNILRDRLRTHQIRQQCGIQDISNV